MPLHSGGGALVTSHHLLKRERQLGCLCSGVNMATPGGLVTPGMSGHTGLEWSKWGV